MDKPTYEELERALVIMTVTGAVAVGGEEFIQEPALGFFNSLTDDDLEKTAEVVNAVQPKFFTAEVQGGLTRTTRLLAMRPKHSWLANRFAQDVLSARPRGHASYHLGRPHATSSVGRTARA